MSQDRGMENLDRHYTATFGHLLEEDYVEAHEISVEYGVNEKEIDWMLDALHRTGYLSHVSSDGGELYSAEDFEIETHQEILDEFNLL